MTEIVDSEEEKSRSGAFSKREAAGGLLLMAAAAAALILANSGLGEAYRHLLHLETGPMLSPKLGPMTVELWINDGLMALFFMLVGLEIKREFLDGDLASPARRRLPIIAAAAGMALPALLYLSPSPAATRTWRAAGRSRRRPTSPSRSACSALLGPRVPASLKLFLTTVAIADDLGAVAIIALALYGQPQPRRARPPPL